LFNALQPVTFDLGRGKQAMNKLMILMILGATLHSAASASTVLISFTALPGTQGNGTTNTQGNTYNGETTATIAGVSSQELVCDDFDNTTYVPSSQIDFSVETLASLSGVDFTSGFSSISGNTLSQVQAYDTAAVLLTALDALTANSGNAQAIADYQYAIWDMMLPSGANETFKDSPLDANALSDQRMAFAAVEANSSATKAEEQAMVIYTPTAAYSSNQEFLGVDTPTATPEPASWVLLAGLGLMLCVPKVWSSQKAHFLASIRIFFSPSASDDKSVLPAGKRFI
jgi:hypothetical protein